MVPALNAGEDSGKQDSHTFTAGENVNGTATWEILWQSLFKISISLA